jgi:recombinational DNA repair protein (RecF pathway)
MRHKYATPAIVLSRTPLAEASALITLLTSEVGLVRARAQGVRKPGAKMAGALQTLVECDVLLLRGNQGWRLAGALHTTDWFSKLQESPARKRAGRIAHLMLRLVHEESSESSAVLYSIFLEFVSALSRISELCCAGASEADHESFADAAECLAALRILHALGVDAGTIPGESHSDFASETLKEVIQNRPDILLRINRGIAASGL